MLIIRINGVYPMSTFSRSGWAVAALLAFGSATLADDRPSHYEGLSADDLQTAVKNFSTYNAKLEALLAKKHLTPEDLAAIHEMTYTLENALGRITTEFAALEESLEEVHQASEHADAESVQEHGARYLDKSRKIIE